jgi:hypothetical protein
LAEAIKVRYEKASIPGNPPYSMAEFLHDKEQIATQIRQYNIKMPADSLFAEADSRIRAGSLLYFYSSYNGFIWQWFLLMAVYFIVILVLRIFGVLAFLLSISKKTKWIIVTLHAGLYLWCFKEKPADLQWYHWIVPALPILPTFIYMYWNEIRRKVGIGNVGPRIATQP